jgi:peptidyl-tRNA hydrolase, PTH1 family
MKLIVGLGNPESRYDNTRHNVGFAMLDQYIAAQKITWREQVKFHAITAHTITGNETIILAKPTISFINFTITELCDWRKVYDYNIDF